MDAKRAADDQTDKSVTIAIVITINIMTNLSLLVCGTSWGGVITL